MNEQSKDLERALDQAKAQANRIAAIVAALSVDYDRLEELRGMNRDMSASEEEDEELRELEEQANGNESEDDVHETILNYPLSVEVRSDWHKPEEQHNTPSEFKILLCTGGPAVQIRGELDDYLQPYRAWIEYQDWFTPWKEAPGIIEQEILLTYCREFYFGE